MNESKTEAVKKAKSKIKAVAIVGLVLAHISGFLVYKATQNIFMTGGAAFCFGGIVLMWCVVTAISDSEKIKSEFM
jgi:hypothetical protein